MNLVKFVLAALLYCSSCISAGAGEHAIVFLGDSLTDGYTLGSKFAYPEVIQGKLIAAGKRARVINAGVSGDTMQNGLSRVDTYLTQEIGVFVVALGANDLFRDVPLDDMTMRLKEILARVRRQQPSAKLVVIGMQDFVGRKSREDALAFKSAFANTAKEFDALYVPFLLEGVANMSGLNLSDGIHPNKKGQEKMADMIWGYLSPLL